MEKAKLQEGDTQNTFLRDRERLRDELSDKEVAAAVADEPIIVGKAFRDMVMQEPEKYTGMSDDEIKAKLIAAFKKFSDNYHIDQEAQERMDAIAGQPDIPHGLEEDIKLTPEEMEKLHKDGKITLPNGSVLYYTGTVKKENQLKEAVKALIKKTLES